MRRGVLFIVIGLLVVVLVAALLLGGVGGILGGQPTPTPPPTQPPVSKVLIALQDIPRGQPLNEDLIGERDEPIDPIEARAQGMLFAESKGQVIGKLARQDIKADQIILSDYVLDTAGYLRGSEVSLFIPPGMVAVAFPVDRLRSVAYAIQPGDRIDILATFLVVSIDEQFQTLLPNYAVVISPEGQSSTVPLGVGGQLPPNNQPVNSIPNPGDHSGQQRPRAVSQLTLENILVLKVGEWSVQPAAPTPVIEETPVAGVTPTPVPTKEPPSIVTVALPRQDALVLEYLLNTGATVEFALRAAGDTQPAEAVQPVTLAYLFQRFQITEPQKLPYTTEPGLWPIILLPQQGPTWKPTPMPHPNPTPAGP